MRKDITVAAEVRASRGKNEARRTRRAGQIPAVVYGAFQDPVSIAVNPREILKIVRSNTGYNTIFTLAVQGGENTPVMVVDSQFEWMARRLRLQLAQDFRDVFALRRKGSRTLGPFGTVAQQMTVLFHR